MDNTWSMDVNAVVKTDQDKEVLSWCADKLRDCDKVDEYTGRMRGKFLCTARDEFPGRKGDIKFGKWREANTDIKPDVAKKLMAVWREFGTELPDWNVSVMYELVSAPPSLVEDMRERYVGGDKPTQKEVRAIKTIGRAVPPDVKPTSPPPTPVVSYDPNAWSDYFKPDAVQDLLNPRPLPKFEVRHAESLNTQSPCAYRLLGVNPLVAKDTIDIVIKGMRQKYHPDRATSKEEGAKLTKYSIRINSAVDHLRKTGEI